MANSETQKKQKKESPKRIDLEKFPDLATPVKAVMGPVVDALNELHQTVVDCQNRLSKLESK